MNFIFLERTKKPSCQRFLVLCVLLALNGILLYAQDISYIVKNGDTIYSLSREYGIKAEEILSANGITNAGKIYAGQKLKIPSPLQANSSSGNEHTVEYRALKGDTLYGIARKHGVSYQELSAVNNFAKNYVLKPGDAIKIPVPAGLQLPRQEERVLEISVSHDIAPQPSQNTEQALDALQWPVMPKESAYIKGKLTGVMLTGEKTESVRSLTAGTVISAGPYRGFGRVVIIKSDNGYDYVYGGCEDLSVRKWDRVTAGTEVGKLGIDTLSAKPRLFFMVYLNGKPIDPAKAPRA
ncbi:MAG: LysM peptidoglycan-binding domain-containing protein [Spirochaetaceae bacterium]|jgi:LysM repeat protein|nr:LysM peptidoglycan-binding domain-containing protein [Spirochaetaceae bacterium]